MKLSPRHVPVNKAELEISEAVSTIVQKYDLTCAEYLQILCDLQQSELRMMLSEERRPDDTKKKKRKKNVEPPDLV